MFGGTAAVNAANPNNDMVVPNGPTDGISCLRWSPVANLLVAGSWDNQIRCWDVQLTGTVVPKASQAHSGPILCCAWMGDGSRVFSGGCDKQAKCWDLATNTMIPVGQHDQPIRHMFWLQEMNCLVTGSWDKTLKYWDCRAPNPQCTVQLPERVYCMDATVRGAPLAPPPFEVLTPMARAARFPASSPHRWDGGSQDPNLQPGQPPEAVPGD